MKTSQMFLITSLCDRPPTICPTCIAAMRCHASGAFQWNYSRVISVSAHGNVISKSTGRAGAGSTSFLGLAFSFATTALERGGGLGCNSVCACVYGAVQIVGNLFSVNETVRSSGAVFCTSGEE